MRKFIVILKALMFGFASIESVDKIRVSRTPGDVTGVCHN
jgi:hypothetical protein